MPRPRQCSIRRSSASLSRSGATRLPPKSPKLRQTGARLRPVFLPNKSPWRLSSTGLSQVRQPIKPAHLERKMTRDEVIQIARAVAKKEGWPWLEPLWVEDERRFIFFGRRYWRVTTNTKYADIGRNVHVQID